VSPRSCVQRGVARTGDLRLVGAEQMMTRSLVGAEQMMTRTSGRRILQQLARAKFPVIPGDCSEESRGPINDCP
jgi:hypothetical protein